MAYDSQPKNGIAAQLVNADKIYMMGTEKVIALNNVSITFKKGDFWAILGPNASGKTTLIKSILGMVLPDQGHILINDNDVLGKWKYKKNRYWQNEVYNI